MTFVRAFPLIVGLGVLGLSCACAATSIGLLAMGDDVATGLGVRVRVVRVSAIVSAIVLVALATAVAGPVAFVALSAPHIAARLCGGGGVGVVSSAVVGAALVLSADVVAQRIVAPAELPVGVVTGVLGGLYLLWILTREEAR